MLTRETTEIAVIGAGVVGLTIALELVDQGREVVLVDPGPPGMGASYGNAGTIADYAVAPVGTGQMVGGTFQATEILAKHDETYMPKEVMDALKEQGVYHDPKAPSDS